MKTQIIVAGFGGQGVLTLGVILANAAVLEDKNATWLPSYGPEMRGGTANCHVIISEEDIGSAVISQPDILIAFNHPSLEKFLPRLKKNGLLIINSSLIKEEIIRKDIKLVSLPLVELAAKIQNQKTINIIAMGALLELTELVKTSSVVDSIKQNFKDKQDIIELNKKALELGREHVKKN
ncbi:2-oxoacid:acceptor oxidoreductase family protein [Candidatus Woesearchaeota archaeon]|nr:2-oxoacid:acceptor oxidoreductase family protein [Candidatus Woesearchaeota archaeon]